MVKWMKKFGFVIDIVIFVTMVICVIYNVIEGCINHDTYYLILGLFSYIILHMSEEDIKNYIDTCDNM